MQAERNTILKGPDPSRIAEIERRIRFLMSLRQQANLEANSYYQLAVMADSHDDASMAKAYLEYAIAKKPGHELATAALADHR